MQTQNLNIIYDGQQLIGFSFDDLPLAAAIAVACQQVDQTADAARRTVLVDPLRAFEYERAALQARYFVSLSDQSEVPPTVQSWADACGITPQAAAESIIVKANAWDAALYAIRDARLKGKEIVKKLLDHYAVLLAADAAIDIIQKSVEGVEIS